MKKKSMVIILILLLVVVVGIIIYLLTRPREIEDMEFTVPQAQAPAEDGTGTVVEISGDSLLRESGEESVDNKQKDYVENQVVVMADSKAEAKKIARQIGGELLSYDNQVAVIQIGITVEEMMQRLEEDPSLPKVYPNYSNYQNYSY